MKTTCPKCNGSGEIRFLNPHDMREYGKVCQECGGRGEVKKEGE